MSARDYYLQSSILSSASYYRISQMLNQRARLSVYWIRPAGLPGWPASWPASAGWVYGQLGWLVSTGWYTGQYPLVPACRARKAGRGTTAQA